MKCSIICCVGLGDALISLVLSENLKSAGHDVVTVHPFVGSMGELFPGHRFLGRDEWEGFDAYDHVFFFLEKSDWMLPLIEKGCRDFRKKVTVLNPIATPNRDYPFWEEGQFDGTLPFVDNLVTFCRGKFGMENPGKSNGIVMPEGRAAHPKRVILHPTSSRKGKNWPKEKFLRLGEELQLLGYFPEFLLTKEEQKEWPEVLAPSFPTLVEVAKFVSEAGAMVGNDSGIGHLASCLGVPTLTICRSKMSADFWRPAWSRGVTVSPPHWVPNLKGLRWRDQKWQRFVSVRRVLGLLQTGILGNEASDPTFLVEEDVVGKA